MYSKPSVKITRLKTALAVLLALSIVSGCSFLDIFRKGELPKASPEGLYARASEEYKQGSYKKAQEHFLRLKEEYPLHDLAVLAEIGVADSLYSDKEYAQAVDTYSDFISLHPLNENVPYAIYQMGMCHYNQMEAIDRDQTETIKARKEWEKLVERYPESKFSTMAEKMLREVKQRLAEREFYIGEFYLKQKKYQAALSRFEGMTAGYPNVGLDYKVEYYINETKAKIAEEEKEKLKADAEAKKKEEQKIKKEEEKKKKSSKK
ncbi:MAG: outer membrane protein assembly factor BamD [Smithella sp.]|jgi:outer membrane protein assembly factor BamD